MKTETLEVIKGLNSSSKIKRNHKFSGIFNNLPDEYKNFLNTFNGGEGSIGNNYIRLWSFSELIELNNDYAVDEFLTNIILIGSDGGDTAYGIKMNNKYIEVPFIGMDDDEVSEIANNFDDFINYISTNDR